MAGEDFPNEPKQLQPGEDIRVIDNRVQVSGQVVVKRMEKEMLGSM